MGWLAPGGTTPVVIPTVMGLAFLIAGLTITNPNGVLTLASLFCFLSAAFLANFYRDPDRPIPQDAGVLVSPADGRVMFVVRERATGRRPTQAESEAGDSIESDTMTGEWYAEPGAEPLDFETEQRWVRVKAGDESEHDCWRVAVFMSPLEVHVNRAPAAASIERMEHRTGKGRKRGPFLKAYLKESEFNERVRTVMRLDAAGPQIEDGSRIEVIQISGAAARTIVPWKSEGEQLRRGERYGMIRLGSRVDLRASAADWEPVVVGAEAKNPAHARGEHVLAGSSILLRAASLGGEEE